jgi:hypothetical protein
VDQRSLQRARQVPITHETSMHHQDIFDEEHDAIWPSRMPSSTRRYRSDVKTEVGRTLADVEHIALSSQQKVYPKSAPGRRNPVPARRTATQPTPAVQPTRRPSAVDTEEIASRPGGNRDATHREQYPRFHWLVYVSLAMFVMLAGWILLSMLINWWQVVQDDWHYGRPRTFQVDQVVGHNDSRAHPSHFIALNLHSRIQIIEFPGGDASKAKVYIGPILIGPDQDLAPVTLTFKDVNGDDQLDMIVNVQDSRFVFVNGDGQFRSPHAGENVQL